MNINPKPRYDCKAPANRYCRLAATTNLTELGHSLAVTPEIFTIVNAVFSLDVTFSITDGIRLKSL